MNILAIKRFHVMSWMLSLQYLLVYIVFYNHLFHLPELCVTGCTMYFFGFTILGSHHYRAVGSWTKPQSWVTLQQEHDHIH